MDGTAAMLTHCFMQAVIVQQAAAAAFCYACLVQASLHGVTLHMEWTAACSRGVMPFCSSH